MSEREPLTADDDRDANEGPADQPDSGIDAQVVHDCILELLGSLPDGEGDERQIYNVQFGGFDTPPGAQGRRFWYCLGRPVLSAEPPRMDDSTREHADTPGVKVIRCGSLFIDKFPEFDGLSDEEVVARKGEVIDDELMFELAVALTACTEEVRRKKAAILGRPIDTVTDTGQYL